MNKTILVLCLLSLSACGGGSSPAATGSTGKSLFALWTRDSNATTVDLTRETFGSGQTLTLRLASGETCSCPCTISGSEVTSTVVMAGCSFTGGGGGVDPGCAAQDNTYTFRNTGTVLSVCIGSPCVTYH